jgi:hypothetical protein
MGKVSRDTCNLFTFVTYRTIYQLLTWQQTSRPVVIRTRTYISDLRCGLSEYLFPCLEETIHIFVIYYSVGYVWSRNPRETGLGGKVGGGWALRVEDKQCGEPRN